MQTCTPQSNPSLALRPRDAAKALAVSERLLWEWTHRGDVPHVRNGRTILYPVDALRDWLRDRTQSASGVSQNSKEEVTNNG